MLDIIYTIKFVHMITMAIMFGTCLCIALFMLFAYRSGNTSVVALVSVFVVRTELILMAPAVALQPLAGYPLAVAVGASVSEFWLVVSVAIYAAVAVFWLASLIIEMRVRTITQDAALNSAPLPDSYGRLFRAWSLLTAAGLAGMIAIMALMIWQPHWD
jgi:uncharacterized membrane protein